MVVKSSLLPENEKVLSEFSVVLTLGVPFTVIVAFALPLSVTAVTFDPVRE